MTAVIEPRTSMTSGDAATPGFIQDHQTRSWVLSEGSAKIPSRSDVMRYAQREIASLRRLPAGWDGSGGVPLRADLATIAVNMIAVITQFDGLATPQFSPLDDGGVHVTWLVGGDRMTMSLETDEIDLRGVRHDGREVFRFARSFGSFDARDLQAAINDARCFLAEMSTRVRHQLLTQ